MREALADGRPCHIFTVVDDFTRERTSTRGAAMTTMPARPADSEA